jgi:hypothetical protein
MLQLLGLIYEVVGVRFWREPSLIRLLYKVFITLLLGEQDRVLLCLEIEMSALHSISRGLPAHQRILPPMPLLQYVPVESPLM